MSLSLLCSSVVHIVVLLFAAAVTLFLRSARYISCNKSGWCELRPLEGFEDLSPIDTAASVFKILADVVLVWASVQHCDLKSGGEGSVVAGSHHHHHHHYHPHTPLSLLSPLGVTDAVVPLATVMAVTLKCYYQTVQMGPAVSSSLHSGEERQSHWDHYSTAHTVWTTPPPTPPRPPPNQTISSHTSKLTHNNKKAIYVFIELFEAGIKSRPVIIQLYSKGICPNAHMLRDWTHTHKYTDIGYTHSDKCFVWPSSGSCEECGVLYFFQPRCRLNEHFSRFLVQPLCCFAFKAAWRRHFGAIQTRLLERAEYKRAESSVSENNTAIPPKPPPPSRWPQLSPVTRLC